MTDISLRDLVMRWPWIVLIAGCSVMTEFGACRFSANVAPVPDESEIKSAGYNNAQVFKINRPANEDRTVALQVAERGPGRCLVLSKVT